MSRTATEKRIIQERRTAERGGVLVPILEKLLETECIPEDEDDFWFLDMLVRVRATPREKGIFSPSMLGSCLRQAYFAKRGEEKHEVLSPQRNGYFLHGNFIHFKWQFATWKAMRAGLLDIVLVTADDLDYRHPMFFNGDRVGVEVRVIDREEGIGGTIDILPRINGEVFVTDYKGVNLIDWQRTVKKGAKPAYRKQIVGYAKLVNKILGLDVTRCLLVSECKAGPVSGIPSPLALHETVVDVSEFEGEVKRRMKTLQWHDDRDEVPPPECVSTAHMQYQECPFSRFCRHEVRAIQKEREARARKNPKDWRVSRNTG